MEPILAELVVRYFGAYLEHSGSSPDSETESEMYLQNMDQGLPMNAHHKLPLPRRAIIEAFEVLLRDEADPRIAESLRVVRSFAEDGEAAYGECILSPERAFAALVERAEDLRLNGDLYNRGQIQQAVTRYLSKQ